jgi:hypothetical protein
VRVNARQLVGHVDNSSFPAITVDIAMTLVRCRPDARTPVPVMIMFAGGNLNTALAAQSTAAGWTRL